MPESSQWASPSAVARVERLATAGIFQTFNAFEAAKAKFLWSIVDGPGRGWSRVKTRYGTVGRSARHRAGLSISGRPATLGIASVQRNSCFGFQRAPRYQHCLPSMVRQDQ